MQNLVLKVSGLYTAPNQFSAIPEGALSKANNIVIDRESVATSRRGFKRYNANDKFNLSTSNKINQMYQYRDRLIVHQGSTLEYDSTGTGTFTAYSGTYNPPSGYRIRFTESNKNLYFTSDSGIQKITGLTTNPSAAGVPKALGGTATLTGSSGFLTHHSITAYRIVWGIKDENSNTLLGAPSGRIVIFNNAGGGGGPTRNINLDFLVPAGITTSYFFQIYRVRQLATDPANIEEPSDEMQLVYEANPTSTEITNKVLGTITDIVTDDLLGAFLYTNPSQEGIAKSNDIPPLAKDVCTFKQITFYANTKTKHRLISSLVGVDTTGAGSGLFTGNTVTVAGITFTAISTGTPTTTQFLIDVASTSPSVRIENSAYGLITAINKHPTITVYAYYLSSYGDLPGKMLFEERSIGGSAFTATSNKATAFSPQLVTTGNIQTSSNEDKPNRVYWSKASQPEAVPLLQYFDIGSTQYGIERIIPLRDSVFVLKLDGIYRIIGESSDNLRQSLFDNTTGIYAPESARAMNNKIYMYGDQGVLGVSDNGIELISGPIEDILQEKQTYTNFSSITYGIAYEQYRKYILLIQESSADLYPTASYVYDIFTEKWTKWTFEASCGFVLNDLLYLGSNPLYDPASPANKRGFIFEERKDLLTSDFSDEEFTITVTAKDTSANTLTVTVASPYFVDDIQEGMVITQGGELQIISSVDVATSKVTVEDSSVFIISSDPLYTAVTVYEPIECIIEWAQNSTDNPGILKHFREITVLMRNNNFRILDLGFLSSIDNSVEYVQIEPTLESAWGTFPWGSIPWGSGDAKPLPIRTYIPLAKRRAHWINFSVRSKYSKAQFAINGLSVMFEPMSERYYG